MSGPNLEDAAYDAAVKTATQIDASLNGDNVVTLASGVQLRIKPVNPLLIQTAGRNIQEPDVPKVYLKDDDKWIPNYADPEYIKNMKKYAVDQQMAVIDVGYLMGTEVVHVPEGISKIEDDDWIDHLEFLGIIDREQVTSNKHARYLAWLKYYAITTDEDFPKLTFATMKTIGVQEGDVQEAVATFPNRKERRANKSRST